MTESSTDFDAIGQQRPGQEGGEAVPAGAVERVVLGEVRRQQLLGDAGVAAVHPRRVEPLDQRHVGALGRGAGVDHLRRHGRVTP